MERNILQHYLKVYYCIRVRGSHQTRGLIGSDRLNRLKVDLNVFQAQIELQTVEKYFVGFGSDIRLTSHKTFWCSTRVFPVSPCLKMPLTLVKISLPKLIKLYHEMVYRFHAFKITNRPKTSTQVRCDNLVIL